MKKNYLISLGLISLSFMVAFEIHAAPNNIGKGCTTAFHVDKDCDGYGKGTYASDPNPLLGSDSDDNDSEVQNADHAISKWGSLTAFLVHLGYNPTRYWILNPADGDNGTCAPNVDPSAAMPCKTFAFIKPLLQSDDMVLFREGTYPAITDIAGGSLGSPIVYMSYPGELAVIDSTTDRIYTVNKSWFVIDGLKLDNSAPNPQGIGISGSTYYGNPSQCLNGTGNVSTCYAGSNCIACPSLYHDITLRNLEITHSYWGINATNGLENYILEDSVIHNDNINSEHNVYLGAREVPSKNVIVRRNLFFNAGSSGNSWKFNGRCTDCILDGNIAHSSYGVGFDFENGWNNSSVSNNLSFNHLNGAAKIYNYDPNTASHICGNPNFICPHDQNHNIFQNNTFWSGANGPGNGSAISQTAFYVFHNNGAQPTTVGDLGNNTYRNNIFVSSLDSHYPLVRYEQPGLLTLAESQLASDTWESNIFYSSVGSTAVISKGETGIGYGYLGYNCTQFATFSNVSNCINTNPFFSDTNTSYNNSVQNFDFSLQSNSPAINAGTAVGAPSLDIKSLTRTGLPDIGAYEFDSSLDNTAPSVPNGLSVE